MEPYGLSAHKEAEMETCWKPAPTWLMAGDSEQKCALTVAHILYQLNVWGSWVMVSWCRNHFEMCRLVVKAISPTWASSTTTKKIFCKLYKKQGFAKALVASKTGQQLLLTLCFLCGLIPGGRWKTNDFRQHSASWKLQVLHPDSCVKSLALFLTKTFYFRSKFEVRECNEPSTLFLWPFLIEMGWLLQCKGQKLHF